MKDSSNDSVVRRRRKNIRQMTKEILGESMIEELPAIRGWLSTGCDILDLAVAGKLPGGFPRGRFSHIFGSESTCKSVFAMALLGSMQRTGGMAFYADVEGTFDHVFAKYFGLNPNDKDTFKLSGIDISNVEELFDVYLVGVINLKDKRPKLVVVDTLTALPSAAEEKSKLIDGTYGTIRAKQIGTGFRKYRRKIAEKDITVVFVDQARDSLGSSFVKEETVSGGRAIKYYSSIRLHLKTSTKIVNPDKEVVGHWIKFEVVKNKVAVPFRRGRFKFLYDYGIDDIATSLYFLKRIQLGEDDANKPGEKFEFAGEEKTLSGMIKFVERENLEKELGKEVVKVWKEIHKGENRKTRIFE